MTLADTARPNRTQFIQQLRSTKQIPGSHTGPQP